MNKLRFISLVFLAGIIFTTLTMTVSSCDKEDFAVNGKLRFSRDTVRFDTVFVARGSATRRFKIVNTEPKPIKITEIKLAGGQNSAYKLNIDGAPRNSATDVEIAANDSLYVYVQVNIDPNGAARQPFIVTDSVLMLTNGIRQKVILEAFGQNAKYIGSRANIKAITQNETWNDPRPYVIYGWLFIDSSATLTIPAGAHVYLHGGIVNKNGFFTDPKAYPYYDGLIYCKGNMRVMGTKENPVFIQGDRLEHDREVNIESLDFTSISAQWQGIFLVGRDSRSNEFNYCNIKNGVVGVLATAGTKVSLKNTLITNMAQSAIIADSAEIRAHNCLFSGSSYETVSLIYGGTYQFDFSTFASYSSYRVPRDKSPVLKVTNWACFRRNSLGTCLDKRTTACNATFNNCIITGSLPDEVSLDKDTLAPFNLTFNRCFIRKEKNKLYAATRTNVTYYDRAQNSFFKDPSKYDFRLIDASVFKDLGLYDGVNPLFSTDLDGKSRRIAPSPTSIGCYEAP